MIFVSLLHPSEDRHGTTFLRKNLHDQITAQCSAIKSSHNYKADIDTLYVQLTALLNEKVNYYGVEFWLPFGQQFD